MSKKLVLVIGGTGVQGVEVVHALLRSGYSEIEGDSQYTVRILTRNPEHPRIKKEFSRYSDSQVEIVKGDVHDWDSVERALDGVWGAFVNTDTFQLGEATEVFTGIRIFELAKKVPTLKHYVWSGLEYITKLTGYKKEFRAGHYDGKGRVTEIILNQPYSTEENEFKWTVLNTGPYLEQLSTFIFAPTIEEDGTRVFSIPLFDGHMPMVSVRDIGTYARWIFDHPSESAGIQLGGASDWLAWEDLVQTFTRVTGIKAVYKPIEYNEWIKSHPLCDSPMAIEEPNGLSFYECFKGWFNIYRNDIIKRDLEFLKRINPNILHIERWIRENNYEGKLGAPILKNELYNGAISIKIN